MDAAKIQAMPAGRVMDCLVSERVFFIAPRDVRVRGSDKTIRVWTDNLSLQDGVWDAEQLLTYGAPPYYSADIDAAWKVVNRLRTFPWYRGIEITDAVSQGTTWTCRIWDKTGGVTLPNTVVLVSETAPLAICRAAMLVASGGSVK